MAYKGRLITNFKDEIRATFPYLFEKWGFKFVDIEDDYGGNIVVAQSDTLRIGFARDRADFFLDIAQIKEPDRWIEFYKIIDQLKAEGHVHIGYKYSNKIAYVSRLLEQCFPKIQALFKE